MKNFTSIFRIFANHILTIVSNIINKQKLTDAHTCYKVFNFEVFNKITLEEKGFGFCPEITTKLSNMNIDIEEIPISYNGRDYKNGKKIKFKDAIEALIVLIKYKFFKNDLINNYKMKKAIIFGATGQDGSYLIELLLKKIRSSWS